MDNCMKSEGRTLGFALLLCYLACTHFMFFSSCSTELAPTSTLVTPFCFSIHAKAFSARASPSEAASSFHFFSCSRSSGVKALCFRKCSFCHAAVLRDSFQITVGEKSLCQRREGDEADAVLGTVVESALLLWLLVQHVEFVLIDEQRTVVLLQIFVGKLQGFQGQRLMPK